MSIQTRMKSYEIQTYGINEYGESQLGYAPVVTPIGPLIPRNAKTTTTNYIKMAIYLSNQATNQNINYTEADYIGITQDTSLLDNMAINYDGKWLKVKTITPVGRYSIVALVKI